MIPTAMATAPSQTRRVTCWPVNLFPSGSAMTRLIVVSDCTTISEPVSRATAWRSQPLAWQPAPTNHTGRRRIWTKNRGSSPSAAVSRVPFCCKTLPTAKAQAASSARTFACIAYLLYRRHGCVDP